MAAAQKLVEGTVDMALAPVNVIPELDTHFVVSDYCIGSQGAVRSVCIQSEVPMDNISELYVDHESRASAALSMILMEEHWNKQIEYIKTEAGYEEQISGSRAGLIIGDRAIRYEGRYDHSWDLGEAWQSLTGLDFVFAAWISRIELPAPFLSAFSKALRSGLQQLDKVISLEKANRFPENFDILDYFTRNISYDLDDCKRRGLELFLQKIGQKEATQA